MALCTTALSSTSQQRASSSVFCSEKSRSSAPSVSALQSREAQKSCNTMTEDKKKKGGSGGQKKPAVKPTKNSRMFANRKMKDAYLIQIAIKLLLDVANSAKASKDSPKDPPK